MVIVGTEVIWEVGKAMRNWIVGLSAAAVAVLGVATGAKADSCWNHNGSLVRLEASGNDRWFSYERPRQSLLAAGVRRGTLLFKGRISGNRYSGTAHVYSRYCPGDPLPYRVQGPVSGNQTRVTLRGQREVYTQCEPTGRYTTDTLVFTYSHRC